MERVCDHIMAFFCFFVCLLTYLFFLEKDPVAEVKVPASTETKEPEMAVDGTASTAVEIRGSGNGESATTASTVTPALLPLPVMNLDLIQQFQAALHTIAG